jgi:hypothetical protein
MGGIAMPENTMTVTEFARGGGQALAQSRTPEQRREAARHAAEIRWSRVRARVAESRKAQGLPEHVEDPHLLGQLAREVLERGGHDG